MWTASRYLLIVVAIVAIVRGLLYWMICLWDYDSAMSLAASGSAISGFLLLNSLIRGDL